MLQISGRFQTDWRIRNRGEGDLGQSMLKKKNMTSSHEDFIGIWVFRIAKNLIVFQKKKIERERKEKKNFMNDALLTKKDTRVVLNNRAGNTFRWHFNIPVMVSSELDKRETPRKYWHALNVVYFNIILLHVSLILTHNIFTYHDEETTTKPCFRRISHDKAHMASMSHMYQRSNLPYNLS